MISKIANAISSVLVLAFILCLNTVCSFASMFDESVAKIDVESEEGKKVANETYGLVETRTIMDRIQEHSESIDTLAVRWTQTVTYAAGSFDGKNLRHHDEYGRSFPGKDAQLSQNCRVVIKGSKWRYETIGVMWQSKVEQFAISEDIAASDGDTCTSFEGIDASIEEAHPTAFLYLSDNTASRARAPQAVPPFLFARPFQKPFGHLTIWGDEPPTARRCAANNELIELVYGSPGQSAGKEPVYQFFYDRPWLLTRMSYFGRLAVEVEYNEINGTASTPSGWTCTQTSAAGETEMKFRAEVTSWEVNVPVDDDEFDLKLPVGTQVWDHTGRKSGASASWIVKENGAKRPVTLGEIQASVSYADLLVTMPDEAIVKPPSNRNWWIIGNSVFVLCVGLFYTLIRRRRRQSE